MDPDDYTDLVRRSILEINGWIRSKGEEMSIPVIDAYPSFEDGKGRLKEGYAAGDNAHLNVEGQEHLARLIFDGYFRDAEGASIIVCLGDSHTQGYPMRTDLSRNGIPIDTAIDSADNYPFFLSKMAGLQVINRGISGNTVYGMLKRFDADVVPHFPDHCVVMGGTNDALIGIRPEETMEDLERIYRKCVASRIVPVACTIVPLGF